MSKGASRGTWPFCKPGSFSPATSPFSLGPAFFSPTQAHYSPSRCYYMTGRGSRRCTRALASPAQTAGPVPLLDVTAFASPAQPSTLQTSTAVPASARSSNPNFEPRQMRQTARAANQDGISESEAVALDDYEDLRHPVHAETGEDEEFTAPGQRKPSSSKLNLPSRLRTSSNSRVNSSSWQSSRSRQSRWPRRSRRNNARARCTAR